MIYSRLYFKNKAYIPFPIAIFIIFLLILFFSRLIHRQSTPLKATNKLLKRFEMTNLTYNQVTIVWQTEEKTTGFILYGDSPSKFSLAAFDERDTAANKNKFLFHSVNLKNLLPEKKYFFVIVSNNQVIKKANNEPFDFVTPKFQLENRTPTFIYGKIFQPNNLPLSEAIVFLSLKNHYLLSTMTKNSGEWLIPLTVVYDSKNLTARIPLSEEEAVVEIVGEDGLKTIIEGKINQMTPIPQSLIIGRNYNFLFEENVLGTQTQKQRSKEKKITIIYPEENAIIPGFTPIIKGTTLPEKTILINLFSDEINKNYTARVTADNNGFWSLKFRDKLALGNYQLVVKTEDENKKEVELRRTFRLIGNQAIEGKVLGEATPSATIEPQPSPYFTPTPIPPTVAIPTPTTPVSGGSNIFWLFSFGILTIIFGLRLFFGF